MRLAPWQRTAIRWIGIPIGILLVLGAVLYFAVLDTSYSRTEFYPDTELTVSAGSLGYAEQPGRITLVLTRGERESPLGFTDTGWREEMCVELSPPNAGERIDVAGPGVRVGYRKLQPLGVPWQIGERGVRGYIHVQAVSPHRLVVEYYVVIDAYAERLLPEAQHREVKFEGTSTFRSGSRPVQSWRGGVWPKM
jgi:hypothetical protein